MDVKGYNVFEGSQQDINRRLYNLIINAEAGDTTAINELKDIIGDDTTANTILKRLKDVEGAIGANDTAAGSLKKRCKDLETTVGDNSSGLVKKANDLETAIGDEDTATSILGRIKALEDAS